MLKRFFTISSHQYYSLKSRGRHSLFSSTKQLYPEMRPVLDLASEFMNSGKIRTAEDIYKKLIDKYPYVEEPYQKLWSSWQAHRSLKVTEKEMNDFIEKYEKYIKPKTDSTKRP